MKKKATTLIATIAILGTIALIGCASITPIDVIWPVSTNIVLDTYCDYKVPSIKVFGWNYTTLAFAKGQRFHAQQYHMAQEFLYVNGMKLSGSIIESADKTKEETMGLLVALSAGTPAIGFMTFLAGKKKKRPEDYTKEQVEDIRNTAGLQNPEDFIKDKLTT